MSVRQTTTFAAGLAHDVGISAVTILLASVMLFTIVVSLAISGGLGAVGGYLGAILVEGDERGPTDETPSI